MSPGDVLARHTSLELTEWFAYFKLEQAEAERNNQTSNVTATVAKKRGKR